MKTVATKNAPAALGPYAQAQVSGGFVFTSGQIGIDLTGANPTPQYAGQTMVSHIMDQGFLQYNMGYATALSVLLLLLILLVSQLANKFFAERD